MDMASGRVKVEEVTMVTYGEGAAEVNRPWPLSWSAVWTGALAAIAMILILGLVGVAVGAHRVGHPFGTWHDVSFLALAWSVFSAFISFAVGGWAAAKVAGLRRSETAMLHGSIAWLVAVPILLAMASLGATAYFGTWYGGLAGRPAWVTPAAAAVQDPKGIMDALFTGLTAIHGLKISDGNGPLTNSRTGS